MKPKIQNTLQLYGALAFTVYDTKDGYKKKLFRHVKRNQITDQGRDIVLALLAQTIAPNGDVFQQNPWENQIWSFGVGSGTTPAQRTDWCLENKLWVSTLDPASERVIGTHPISYTYAPLWELLITKTVPAPEPLVDGNVVTEAALFTRGEDDDYDLAEWAPNPLNPGGTGRKRMYARQIHAPVAKTATMIIEYEWRLGITVQI